MTSAAPRRHTRFVAYYRVSTKGQQVSGLGLAAQEAAVRDYVERTLSTLVAEFTEAESGRKTTRPQLHAALTRCAVERAVLVIAKLDRLARNVAFLTKLMEDGVEFVALDMPGANRFTIQIMAAVAEQEARRISENTKAGLRQARLRGKKLGGLRPHNAKALKAAHAAKREMARAYYTAGSLIADLVLAWRQSGETYQAIAHGLMRRKVRTSAGGTHWTPSMARRVVLMAQSV